MASALFESYNKNLKRIFLAEFVADQLRAQVPWYLRSAPGMLLHGHAASMGTCRPGNTPIEKK